MWPVQNILIIHYIETPETLFFKKYFSFIHVLLRSKNLKRNKSVSGPVDDVSMAAPIERPIQANAEPEGMDDILSQYLPGNQSKGNVCWIR